MRTRLTLPLAIMCYLQAACAALVGVVGVVTQQIDVAIFGCVSATVGIIVGMAFHKAYNQHLKQLQNELINEMVEEMAKQEMAKQATSRTYGAHPLFGEDSAH